MRFKTVLIIITFLAVLLFSGCETLRLAPTESQRQSAAIGSEANRLIFQHGSQPASEVAKTALDSAMASAAYFGPPNQMPDDFDAAIKQAAADASKRPSFEDIAETTDSYLQLGIGLAAVLGGVYGTKAAKTLSTIKAKANAFGEVVKGSEVFAGSSSDEVWKEFKQAQARTQSKQTQKLVALEKKELA